MSDALVVEDLTVEVGGRRLLHGAGLTVGEGEVVLLAGPSGSGKTVFLGLVTGLVGRETPGFSIRGRIAVHGRDVLADRAARGEVGIVFQDFALFSGWSAAQNVDFALDHRRPALAPDEVRRTREGLIGALGLEADAGVTEMSGGQRQRVAIARALAFDPRVLVYDEPTSGLDPRMRNRVADRIRETSRERGTTTVVVTHDLAGLLSIADRVVLLDPVGQSLVEVPVSEAIERLEPLEVPEREAARTRRRRGPIRLLLDALDATGGAVAGLGSALFHLVPRWRSGKWGARFLLHYLRTVAGPGALRYFLLAGVVIGLVTTYFTFTFLPYRQYTEALILDDLVGALGFGLHRILVPLLMTILLAARAGAAVAADVSTRVAGRQTDAMRSLGAEPSRYLLTGTLWAFLLGTPVIGLLAFLGARAASVAVFSVMAPDVSLFAWDGMFHRLLTEPGQLLPNGTGWVLGKELIAAFGIGAIAWFHGARPKSSPADVARAITATVIGATVFTLAVHTAFALIEF